MRCPACGEGNSDKAVVCELCQAPLRSSHPAVSMKQQPRPQVVPSATIAAAAPKAAAPINPKMALAYNTASPALYLPQPTAKQGLGLRGLVLVLVGLGGAGIAAYRYWPQPGGTPLAPPATTRLPSTPANSAALPAALRPTELAPPQPKPRPTTAGAASPSVEPIVEIRPAEPRGTRSVSSSWFEGADGFERAKKDQAYGNVPMIIYFRVDWCPYCRRMDQDIIDSSAVREFLSNVVKVRVNPESSPADGELARRMGVKGFPSVFVVPRPGASATAIQSLSRKANEPMELSVEKFISAAKGVGIHQAQNHVVEGFDKLNRGDTAGARADLDRAIEMDPKNADAYFWRGEADAKAGELGKAVGNFKRALELEPDRKDALFALANLYSSNREYDEAITYLTRAARVAPDYAQGTAFAQRAFAYKMKGDLDAARADFAEACQRGNTSACAQAQR